MNTTKYLNRTPPTATQIVKQKLRAFFEHRLVDNLVKNLFGLAALLIVVGIVIVALAFVAFISFLAIDHSIYWPIPLLAVACVVIYSLYETYLE